MNYRKLIIAPLLIIQLISLKGQNDSEIRNYIKSFPVRKNVSLELTNKYGSVHLTTWEKDSVTIRAEIIAYAPDMSKTKKMFDGVNINITDYDYVIRARTEFSQSFSMIVESFKGMTNRIIPYDSRLEINYYVNLPGYLDINIENRYGDVFMENSLGNVHLTISNGALKAGSLAKASSLNLSFCDAVFNSIVSGRIDASLSEIRINETSDLTIKSMGSKFEIGKAGEIRTESRRDKFYIDTVESVSGNAYFGDFRIENLVKELDVTLKYGDLTAENIYEEFGTINIISAYSDINLSFSDHPSYKIDLRYVNAYVSLPRTDTETEKRTLDEGKKEYLITGKTGRNITESEVRIDATRGNIFLK